MLTPHRRVLVLLALLVLVGPACGLADGSRETADRSGDPNVLTVTATDFAFDVPGQVPAGVTTVRMVNRGNEFHHVTLVKLEEGKTLDELLAAVETHGPPPAWAHHVGGPNAVGAGAESSATLVLEPGRYAVLCYVFGPDGVPHIAKGMAATLEVTGPLPEDAALPPADLVMKLVDYGYHFPEPVKAGRHVIRVENDGPQIHEVVLVRMNPGKTLEDFGRWVMTGEGEAPGEVLGGVSPLDAGRANQFSADLTPGNYALLCFVPDEADGKLHLDHGMVKLFTIS